MVYFQLHIAERAAPMHQVRARWLGLSGAYKDFNRGKVYKGWLM